MDLSEVSECVRGGGACFMHYVQSSKVGGASQQEVSTRLVCAAGLAELEFGKYKNAARLLTRALIDHCKFQDVSSVCACDQGDV